MHSVVVRNNDTISIGREIKRNRWELFKNLAGPPLILFLMVLSLGLAATLLKFVGVFDYLR